MNKVGHERSVVNQLVDNEWVAVIDRVAGELGDVHIPVNRECEVV